MSRTGVRTRGQGRAINGLPKVDEEVSSHNEVPDNSISSTPVKRELARLRQRLDDPSKNTVPEDSPTLAMLRETPGRKLKEKQQALIDQHNAVKENKGNLHVGGGVSLWPTMDRMRLTKREILKLVFLAAGLIAGVIVLFLEMHGSTLNLLCNNTHRLTVFWSQHPINISASSETFKKSVLIWHTTYRRLLDNIQQEFDLSRSSCLYQCTLGCYLLGLCVLVYYLMDNMFSKSRLTPRRIKAWVCLLAVIVSWTVLMLYFLVVAQQLENAVEANVHGLFAILADLMDSDFDLQQFNMIMIYWRTRCLPPTTYGTLTILGLLPVRSVAYYVQYYSLPVITVLLTPILKLVSALCQVYTIPPS